MIHLHEQLYMIRYIMSGAYHGGNQGTTVPRLYQENTAIREAKKINKFNMSRPHLMAEVGLVEVVPVFMTVGQPMFSKQIQP